MDKDEILRQMIAEKERQIELYQAMIAEWRRELGQFPAILNGPVSVAPSEKKASEV